MKHSTKVVRMKQDKRADREVRLAQALGLSKSPEEARSISFTSQTLSSLTLLTFTRLFSNDALISHSIWTMK